MPVTLGNTSITSSSGTISTTNEISIQKSDGNIARLTLGNTNRIWTISNYGTQLGPDGSFVIADENAAAVRFTVNTAGHVTMPFQPGFRAGRSSSALTVNFNTTFIFDSVSGNGRFNTGGHYNTANGVFTAPVTGRYLFAATVILQEVPNNRILSDLIELFINGVSCGYSIRRANYVANTTGSSAYFVDFIHGIFPLNANDSVDLRNRNGSGTSVIMHNNAQYCVFEGTFLG